MSTIKNTNLQDTAVKNAGSATYTSDVTQNAKAKADSYGTNPYATFQTSQKTNDAYSYLQNIQNNEPSAYQSRYSDVISDLLDQVVNRKEFSYDFNADPLYQQYRDQYVTQGKNAMKDTVAQAANMTGGYGNSYGVTAGSQAYQSYLQQLNNQIPALYQQAMNKYQMDTDNLLSKYNTVGSQEDREYGQWSNNYDNWQENRNYALDAYGTMWNQDMSEQSYNSDNWLADRDYYYGRYRDSVSDDQNAYNNAYTAARDERDYSYQQNRDQISDSQWQAQFDYQKERDQIADEQWAMEYALSKAKSGSSGNLLTSISSDIRSEVKSLADEDPAAAMQYMDKLVNDGVLTAEQADYMCAVYGIDFDSSSSYELDNHKAGYSGGLGLLPQRDVDVYTYEQAINYLNGSGVVNPDILSEQDFEYYKRHLGYDDRVQNEGRYSELAEDNSYYDYLQRKIRENMK